MTLRERLEAKGFSLAWYDRAKEEPKFKEDNQEQKPVHTHTWDRYRKTLISDNPDYDGRHTDTYLVLVACPGCKEKRTIDLRFS